MTENTADEILISIRNKLKTANTKRERLVLIRKIKKEFKIESEKQRREQPIHYIFDIVRRERIRNGIENIYREIESETNWCWWWDCC